jgi:hypothetical protein
MTLTLPVRWRLRGNHRRRAFLKVLNDRQLLSASTVDSTAAEIAPGTPLGAG